MAGQTIVIPLQRGKGGLVNIVQHFCNLHRILVAQSDWLMWRLSLLYWASLPQTTEAQQRLSF